MSDTRHTDGLSVFEWARERLANSERIAYTKEGADREGWFEDIRYWRQIVIALSKLSAKGAVVGATPETAQYGDPQPAWTVGAHYVLGGWRRDISDLAGLVRAVNQGIDASPIGQVSVVRHGRPFTDEPGWAVVGAPVSEMHETKDDEARVAPSSTIRPQGSTASEERR